MAVLTTPGLGPVPARLTVDAGTVQQLVAEQFPQWSARTIEPVGDPGWDNYTFRLGADLLVRLPSAAEYALAVEKEQRWLPRLAPRLTVPIPAVFGRGVPGAGYPFPWSVYGWLAGRAATDAEIADHVQFAAQLADFLVSLRRVDAADGPRPGLHNWYRGGSLVTYDATVRQALETLAGHIDVAVATEIWAAALAEPWPGEDIWFHGDLAPGNLLIREGQLAAVIDFGTCGVGDPSCDLAIAWTLLSEPGRQAFRERLQVDAGSWARGRGWAWWKTLSGLAAAISGGDDQDARLLERVLQEIVTEYASTQ